MDEIPARPKRNFHNKRKTNTKHKCPSSESTSSSVISTTEVSDESDIQFSKREVSSNWNKYVDSSSIGDIEVPAADFEQLILAPSSIGGHFLFNSEKHWEGRDDWYNRDEYFQLNLVELTQSLATIPFYERQNYGKNYFSSEEIEDMERQAKYQRFKWEESSKRNLNADKSIHEPVKSKFQVPETQTETVVNVPQNDDDDLDELLNLPGTMNSLATKTSEYPPSNPLVSVPDQLSQHSSTTVQCSATDDIQKWLDDVLILDN